MLGLQRQAILLENFASVRLLFSNGRTNADKFADVSGFLEFFSVLFKNTEESYSKEYNSVFTRRGSFPFALQFSRPLFRLFNVTVL